MGLDAYLDRIQISSRLRGRGCQFAGLVEVLLCDLSCFACDGVHGALSFGVLGTLRILDVWHRHSSLIVCVYLNDRRWSIEGSAMVDKSLDSLRCWTVPEAMTYLVNIYGSRTSSATSESKRAEKGNKQTRLQNWKNNFEPWRQSARRESAKSWFRPLCLSSIWRVPSKS